jgi:hypothetical protein
MNVEIRLGKQKGSNRVLNTAQLVLLFIDYINCSSLFVPFSLFSIYIIAKFLEKLKHLTLKFILIC